MDRQIVNSIINSLNNTLMEKGEYAQFNDPSYKPIKIDKSNFHEILEKQSFSNSFRIEASKPFRSQETSKSLSNKFDKINKEESSNKLAFIDGGNIEILKAPNFSLQLIRIYYNIYQNNKKISSNKKEFYILINAINQKNNIIYKTEFFGLEKSSNKSKLEFNSFDETIRQGTHRISISTIGNVIRRFTELETAKDLTDELNSNDIIIIDGDLKASITDESDYLEDLYKKAKEKNIIIAALSKTSELFTETGNALIPVLSELAPKTAWSYYPLVKIENKNHKIDMYIIKLNRSSRYIFKFEVSNNTDYNIKQILSLLKDNSIDPVFLGYPYGLIEADQFARVSNKEKDYLKTIFLSKLGQNNEKIAQYLNTLNTHSILDSISY